MWKILVVDDDPSVLELTEIMLKNLKLLDQGIEILSTDTTEAAKQAMKDNTDIALIILDIVMETTESGFEFIDYVRNTLENNTARIIVRTGESFKGWSPSKVAKHYGIHDYLEKMDLTKERFVTVITCALRYYQHILERMRFEEMMVQTEKMKSVAGLAAGVAHEINNPLNITLQSIQNILQRTSAEMPRNQEVAHECHAELDQICAYLEKQKVFTLLGYAKEATQRTASIVANMLQFSQHSDAEKEPVDLVELVNRAIELAGMDYNLKKQYHFCDIQIIREFDDNVPQVRCILTEIQQVLLNLLNNAAQAMYSATDANSLQNNTPQIILRIQQEDERVRLEVEDNGEGMDEITCKRAFEPFFTTKQKGSGTGLGLSVSYFIITANHQGAMTLESTPGQGTKFIIHLPL